jgi:hypothetical protein
MRIFIQKNSNTIPAKIGSHWPTSFIGDVQNVKCKQQWLSDERNWKTDTK